jgi:hypothetical protein
MTRRVLPWGLFLLASMVLIAVVVRAQFSSRAPELPATLIYELVDSGKVWERLPNQDFASFTEPQFDDEAFANLYLRYLNSKEDFCNRVRQYLRLPDGFEPEDLEARVCMTWNSARRSIKVSGVRSGRHCEIVVRFDVDNGVPPYLWIYSHCDPRSIRQEYGELGQ